MGWLDSYNNSVQTLLLSRREWVGEGEGQRWFIFVDHVFSSVPDRDRASSRDPWV